MSHNERVEVMRTIVTFLDSESVGVDLSAVAEDDSLGELGVDSSLLIASVVHCEDHYGILISDEELSNLLTVADVISAVLRSGREEIVSR